MMHPRPSIDFTLGSRRLLSVKRRLARWSFGLEDVLAHQTHAALAPPTPDRDGLQVLSAPQSAIPAIIERFPDHLIGARQDYPRHYIAMAGESFEAYLARFSGKTRSTLRRKARKLAKDAGGAYHVTEHRTPAEIERFLDAALPLSARTYQARLLDAGLPDSAAERVAFMGLAEQDRMRAFLLYAGAATKRAADGAPIAYLALPIHGQTVVYAHLGYDPDWARLSPGTVLQMDALERLFAEARYRYFDFTQGDGAHKAMFGTHQTPCASFSLLEPTVANRALVKARAGFDAAVSGAKALAQRSGALGALRSALRA
ncbi:MAG: GNAT family N-acetyltransferase [Pseudomonadota bacterium]